MKFIAGAMSDILGSRVTLGELFDLDFETIDGGDLPQVERRGVYFVMFRE
jgi:hypothetical protein